MSGPNEVAQLLARWNALENPEEQFDRLIKNLSAKVIHSFDTVEQMESFFAAARTKLGLPDEYTPGNETQRGLSEIRRRVLNRISARRSRKRKEAERRELVEENQRLRKRVRELETKVENLEHNWIGCCALCIWQEMEFMEEISVPRTVEFME